MKQAQTELQNVIDDVQTMMNTIQVRLDIERRTEGVNWSTVGTAQAVRRDVRNALLHLVLIDTDCEDQANRDIDSILERARENR